MAIQLTELVQRQIEETVELMQVRQIAHIRRASEAWLSDQVRAKRAQETSGRHRSEIHRQARTESELERLMTRR